MRVPRFEQRPGWLRFFAGVIIGVLIGWGFFLHQNGQAYESLILKLTKQEGIIRDQEYDIEELRRDQKLQNEENQKKLTIQEIQINFTNDRQLRLNQLTLYELEQQALDELKFLERKDIETVFKTSDLMRRTIENKTFKVGDNDYGLKIVMVSLYTTLQLDLEIVPSGG